ncbi:uncharacterized protein LOC129615833 [Condylostylus longicornis]|uniref:uncharacterized protein LOC129615833 n=1 Tax=Condylostylus longicornis TaxID=2530218 RepID=UPI00244E08B4|nr:uncharacterized protein LOC129615833 [Condylostylus longicornis]
MDEVCHLLDTLNSTIHIIIFTETWILEHENELVNIKNYSKVLSCRSKRRGGGCGIFVHDNIRYKAKEIFCDEVNSLVCVNLNIENEIYSISAIYRPPNNATAAVEKFLNILDTHMETLNNKIIVGDFNFNIIGHINHNIDSYKLIVETNGFFFCNKNITRPTSASCLDHILMNDPANKYGR